MLTPAHAQTADASRSPAADSPVAFDVFQGPKTISTPAPHYPRIRRDMADEGWVYLNFMVSRAGKAYALAVTDSRGGHDFEAAALLAVSGWTFRPASLNGVPVEASSTYKVTFRGMQDHHEYEYAPYGTSCSIYEERYMECRSDHFGAGARLSVVRRLRGFHDAIDENDQAAASAILASLAPKNLVEDALLSLALYDYNVVWGDEAHQLQALRRAIAQENKPHILVESTFIRALQSLLLLEVKNMDFSSAQRTWHRLQDSGADRQMLAAWDPILADMERLRTDQRSYSVPGEIGSNSSWFFGLFKHRFHVAVSNGQVSELKLRCDRQYVYFAYDPQMIYRLSDQVDQCELEVIGTPGTQIELLQL